MQRNDFALVTHKPKPMDVSNEALYGQVTASPTPKLSLVEEFKTAAQEFVDAADAGAELDKHIKRFRDLLA
ncbi:hypothetical protein ELG76_04135 [Rhizobium leguminosarum]|uniref:hypothetical protein n=1 Tax=Rhizobium leguminosarum TaxID=384 RepID=UPI001031BA75|nr:hypothetical protein [Rhizobium leguminosarum]TBG78609.1 hypothetical protein ELG76_04135 [Rhizobium leguminosarum]